MTTILRFADLKARGIVRSWPSLNYKVKHDGFPAGFYLGANSRCWYEHDVKAWLDSRPTVNPRGPRRSNKALSVPETA